MTTIIALDMASKRWGTAYGNDWIVFSSQPGRSKGWLDAARMLINICQYPTPPDVVAIEDVYFAGNPATFKLLAKLQGYVEGRLTQMGITVLIATTAQIDTACGIATGIPREQRKQATRRVAEMLLPGTKLSQDECDAICVLVWAQGKVKVMGWQLQMEMEA